MSALALNVSPASVAQAYSRTAVGAGADTGFSAMLGHALQGVVRAGNEADAQSMKAINGGGNITEVVTAVSHAELALQSAIAIRDKVVQAYQDVMRMPI